MKWDNILNINKRFRRSPASGVLQDVLLSSILYFYSLLPSVPNRLHNDDGRPRVTSIQLVCGDISELKLMSALLDTL